MTCIPQYLYTDFFLIIIFQDFHKVYLWQRNWEEMPTHVLGTNAGTIKISRLVNFYFFYVKSWSAWVTAAATVYIIWNTSTVFSLHTNKNRGPYSTNVFKGNIWGKLPALGLKFSLRLMVARRVGVDFYLLFNIAYAFQYFLCKRTHGKYSNPSKQWILLNFYLKRCYFSSWEGQFPPSVQWQISSKRRLSTGFSRVWIRHLCQCFDRVIFHKDATSTRRIL